MRGGGEASIIERWKALASQEPDSSLRADHGAIVTLFAELTDCVPPWKSALEGWNMRESTVVAGWKAEARRSDLRLVLEHRFGAPLPANLVTTIEAQADPDLLSRWFVTALGADSLEAFRSAIAQPQNGVG